MLDGRYHHDHYCPPRGAVVRELPPGYHPYRFGGSRFYFSAGVWYTPGPNGFIVARPPVGLVITVLPPFYITVWFGGVPYYYANDVYYRWSTTLNGYEVVDPPAVAEQPQAAPPDAAVNFYIYPKNGRSPGQQSADRYECHTWAKSQTGADPTQAMAAGPAERDAKQRKTIGAR